MKIKRFIGKKVWGYMDFDISFNDGLNFLIGVNGTGKTTILRLLKGLLHSSLDDLKEIAFQEVCAIDDNNVKSEASKNTKYLTFNNKKIDLSKPSEDGFRFVSGASIFLELNRLNNYSNDALEQVRTMFYNFVRTNVIVRNRMDVKFRESVLRLSKNGNDDLAEKLHKLDDDYSKKINELNAPITRFVKSVNLFFRENDKELQMDDSGEIIITITDKKETVSIFDLSSGEKQLIIMFAHIAVRHKSSVFIIDEPELSLHLSWQYKFADALQTANPDAQFILATHAAGIIAKKSNEQYCIDLTPKKND